MFDTKSEKNIDSKKQFNYLKYIAEAITADSKNAGTYRKQIWSYLLKNYEAKVEYREFLFVIQRLLKEGKLINRAGVYEVEQTVYTEILESQAKTKSMYESRSHSIDNNPFLKDRSNSRNNPFVEGLEFAKFGQDLEGRQ